MEPGIKFIDLYQSEWKVGFKHKDSGLVSFDGQSNTFQCKKTAKFRTHTSLTSGNEDLLYSYNFMDKDNLSKILQTVPKSYSAFRSYFFFSFKQFVEYYMATDTSTFNEFEKILAKLLDFCLETINDSSLVFVDCAKKQRNECDAWPEVFYFFRFFLRLTEESRNFFRKYKPQIKENCLVDSRRYILTALGYLRPLSYLFKKENCLRFIYELEIFLEFKELVASGLRRLKIEDELIENPYRNILSKFNEYLKTTDFEFYCPERSRRLLIGLVNIIDELVIEIEKNSKMRSFVEVKLIEINFNAFKTSKTITKKIKLAAEIDILLDKNNHECEMLAKCGYFSMISEHLELIQNSSVFIKYCMSENKLTEIGFYKTIKQVQSETFKHLLKLQSTTSVKKEVVEQVKSLVNDKFKADHTESFITLLGDELTHTKDLHKFLNEVKKISSKQSESLTKMTANMLIKEKFIVFLPQLFENCQFSKDSFEFNLACEILKNVSPGDFLALEKKSDLIRKVLESPVQAMDPEVHGKLIDLVFRKNSKNSEKDLKKIAELAKNNEFLVEYIDSWLSNELLTTSLNYFMDQLFLNKGLNGSLSEKKCFIFVKMFKKLYLNEPPNSLDPKVTEYLLRILFDFSQNNRELNDLATETLIQVFEGKNHHDKLPHIAKLIEDKLKLCTSTTIKKNFLFKILEKKINFSNNFISILFLDLNHSNIDELSEVFLAYSHLLNEFINNYSAEKLNDCQNYLILKCFANEEQGKWKLLFENLKKKTEYPKLAQLILGLLDKYAECFKAEYEISENFMYLSLLVIKNDFKNLDSGISIGRALKKFIEHKENDLSYVENLFSQGLIEYDQSIYDPYELLEYSVSKKEAAVKYCCSFLNENIPALIKSSHLKRAKKFVMRHLFKPENIDLEGFCNDVFINSSEINTRIPTINGLEILYSAYKLNPSLPIFAGLVEILRSNLISYDESLMKNSRACGLAYKFLLRTNGSIPNLQENFQGFCEIASKEKKEKLQKYTKIFNSAEKGLKNPGNVCYANTAILILSQIPALVQNLVNNYNPSLPLTSSLLYIFSKLYNTSLPSIDAVKILNKSGEISISHYEQRDTDEFITEILNLLSLEIGETVYDRLQVEVNRKIVCQVCNNVSQSTEKLNRVELECKENQTVSQMFENFGQDEKLEGQNQYFCEQCSVKVDALKSYSVKSMPNEVIFMIKRFSYSILRNQKIKLYDKVVLEDKIKAHSEDQGQVEYNLTGFIVHTGNENAGHYFYYKKCGKNWFYISDQCVEILEDFKVCELEKFLKGHDSQKSTPYLLLYSRHTENPIVKLPDDIEQRTLAKNEKYLKICLFCRADIIDVILQLVNLNTDPCAVINYLFYCLTKIVQSKTEFMKNSKKLLKAFESIENCGSYIEYLLAYFPLENFFEFDFDLSPESYLFFSIFKIMISRSSNELKFKFYEKFCGLLNKPEYFYKNLTFHFDLYFSLMFELYNPDENLMIEMFNLVIRYGAFRNTVFSMFYQNVSVKYAELLRSYNLSLHIVNNFENLMSTLTRPQCDPLAQVLIKIDQSLITYLMQSITNSVNSIKYPLLISLFIALETAQSGCLSQFYNYFFWLFQNSPLIDYPRLITLVRTCLNPIENQQLSQNFIVPKISEQNFQNKDLVALVEKLNQDLLNPNSDNRAQNKYFDPNTCLSYPILDQIRHIVLIECPNAQVDIKLLYHS